MQSFWQQPSKVVYGFKKLTNAGKCKGGGAKAAEGVFVFAKDGIAGITYRNPARTLLAVPFAAFDIQALLCRTNTRRRDHQRTLLVRNEGERNKTNLFYAGKKMHDVCNPRIPLSLTVARAVHS